MLKEMTMMTVLLGGLGIGLIAPNTWAQEISDLTRSDIHRSPKAVLQDAMVSGIETSPMIDCAMSKVGGTGSWFFGNWSPGFGFHTYFDPEIECGSGAYPYEIWDVSTTFDSSGTWPVNFDVVVWDLATPGSPCDGPGAELFRFGIAGDFESFAFPNVGTVTAPVPITVTGPVFVGIQYTAGVPNYIPGLICDDQIPVPCDNWYNFGGFFEWSNLFGDPPSVGYPFIVVGGNAVGISDVACGNINGDPENKVNLADITRMMDYLFISEDPIPDPEVANVDLCDEADVADLVALVDHVYFSLRPLCTGDLDCSPELPDDAVQLRLKHRPYILSGDSTIQIDLLVRRTVPLAGVSMGFSWDLNKLSLDSVNQAAILDSIFNQSGGLVADDSLRHLSFRGTNLFQTVSGGPINEYVLWGSYFFTVDNWQAGDSVTFDVDSWSRGTTFKFAAHPDYDSSFIGFVPRWDGPLVVRDASDYGDLDGSGNVNINDITAFVDYLLLGEPLNGPADVGNVDMCDGTDIADLHYLIEHVFIGAPLLSEAPCDAFVPGDTIGVRFTSTPSAVGQNGKALAVQALELELFVSNIEVVLGATMGFEWSARNLNNPGNISHLNLQLDSAKGTALTITGFDAGLEFYEEGSLAISNANSHFQFAGSTGPSGSGVGGFPTTRLWAKYFFTLSNFQEGDEILIDTTHYSDGTTFKMASGGSGGHEPGWDPDIIFDCCGSYTFGMTGNVNWENQIVHFRCDPGGERNLADITRLIDNVYISKEPLCCREDGNTNGDVLGHINLADIQRLIDHVYESKEETEPCL